jgi:Holliday junction resolvase RusA-like endonuclease
MTLLAQFKLLGEVPGKKNQWHIRGDGKGMYMAQGVKDWNQSIGWQLKAQLRGFKSSPGPLRLVAHFYILRDKDLDNMLATVMDGLQKMGVLQNDRTVFQLEATKTKVKKEPHVDIQLHLVV